LSDKDLILLDFLRLKRMPQNKKRKLESDSYQDDQQKTKLLIKKKTKHEALKKRPTNYSM